MYRPTWAEVDLDAIKRNVEQMKVHANGAHIMAVVKANGYGHGDRQVALAALQGGATSIAVACLDEAIPLRSCVKAPILVLGAVDPKFATVAAENDIAVTALDVSWVESVATSSWPKGTPPLRVHLKVDTGMGRLGMKGRGEVLRAIELVQLCAHLEWEGIYTHFATADEEDTDLWIRQQQAFDEILKKIPFAPPLVHTSNSAAGLRMPRRNEAIRFGISMYGLNPSAYVGEHLPFPLHPAMSLHTELAQVKQLQKGDSVSYGATYTADDSQWIGVLPIGYADGWIRALQGFDVLIAGMRVPIVGRICMDQCMIKLPREFPVGERVTLFGKQGQEEILLNEVANYIGTISYEIPCLLSQRVPRIYKRGSERWLENDLFIK
ncbi:alanine racemase [Bacillus fonticola]|uniref:alanine racemase n=1 Tax=Bacillus fonticola TaxID=2728853 RepID=UPI001475E5ED|nr:alanine racemase [Bacillus fonticola]